MKDEKLKNWIAENADFQRATNITHSPYVWGNKDKPSVGGKTTEKRFVGIPPDKGITADGTVLKFKGHFFQNNPAKRDNLIAFEAGKVFWNRMKDRAVGDGRSLGRWFSDELAGNNSAIKAMQAARHGGDDLSELDDWDTASQFAYVFRAQALGLKKPRHSGEWDEVIDEFRENVNPLLKVRTR
ncbi:MAG: hypothetical protein HY913_10590 [Desulfomonile tiedjei]|nr:hypothetical protein [Desulfomonile tiedjei]